jgi:hypothetical protein
VTELGTCVTMRALHTRDGICVGWMPTETFGQPRNSEADAELVAAMEAIREAERAVTGSGAGAAGAQSATRDDEDPKVASRPDVAPQPEDGQ